MKLACPECRQSVAVDDVNLENGLARCRACNTVFSFQSELSRNEREVEALRTRPPIDPPAGLRIEDFGLEFTVRWRWFQGQFLGLLFFCAIWDGFLVVWYVGGIVAGAPWFFLVFPILHVAVGVGLTYYALCGLVNRSVLRLAGGELTVRHGPIPGRRQVDLAVHQIRQLYCQEGSVTGKKSGSTYDLHAVLTDGSDVVLVSGLGDSDRALYLEQQLEKRMGIADEAVGGELPR